MGIASLHPSYGLFEIESESRSVVPAFAGTKVRGCSLVNKNGGPFGPPLMRM
jgi:hypothetical protein